MKPTRVNSEILVLARESRGFTQGELAKRSGVSQSMLSKYENDLCDISIQHLTDIATALDFPESLFTRPTSIYGFDSACLYHRKRQTMPVRDLRRIQAQVNLKRLRIERLLRSVEIEPVHDFPKFDITEYEDPGLVANLVRQSWRLPVGPIRDLVATIERTTAIVVPFSFGTRKLDAISQWPRKMPPVFFVNTDMPWERVRFSLAHEIGHLVMHRSATPNQEQEADRFASAFLMPSRDIKMDLRGISLQVAAQMKPYWRVSMQALIRRAYDLQVVTESRYRRLFTEISKMGWRIKEPYSISGETPFIFKNLVKMHLVERGYTIKELASLLDLHLHEFQNEYLDRPPDWQIREVT